MSKLYQINTIIDCRGKKVKEKKKEEEKSETKGKQNIFLQIKENIFFMHCKEPSPYFVIAVSH